MDKRFKVNFCPWPNFGDSCVPYIFKKLNIPFIFAHHTCDTKATMIGSILNGSSTPGTYVWGTGLMHAHEKPNVEANYVSVRGPRTLSRMKELGADVANTLVGDPAMLLDRIYKPSSTDKKYKLGVICHISDGDVINYIKSKPEEFSNTKIITSTTQVSQVEQYIDDVNSCEKIVSTSLHGVICSHAYNIPVKWFKASDNLMGDDVKFQDHFESLNMSAEENKITELIDENVTIPATTHVSSMTQLMDSLWHVRPWIVLGDEYYTDILSDNWITECYYPTYVEEGHKIVGDDWYK